MRRRLRRRRSRWRLRPLRRQLSRPVAGHDVPQRRGGVLHQHDGHARAGGQRLHGGRLLGRHERRRQDRPARVQRLGSELDLLQPQQRRRLRSRRLSVLRKHAEPRHPVVRECDGAGRLRQRRRRRFLLDQPDRFRRPRLREYRQRCRQQGGLQRAVRTAAVGAGRDDPQGDRGGPERRRPTRHRRDEGFGGQRATDAAAQRHGQRQHPVR